MKKEKLLHSYFKYLIFFVIGSFLGWLWETILFSIKRGHFVNCQGVIYGPFSPIYGFGIVLGVFLLEKYRLKEEKLKVFLFGGLYLGIAEYIGSILQEYVFHTYSWDYSNYPLNFQGRTSVIHMIYWGIGIFLFMQFVYPLIMNLINIVKDKLKLWLVIVVSIFLVIDIGLSCLACSREYERYKNIPASSKLDIFLDRYYTNQLLEEIYPNKKFIEKKEK